MTRFVREVDRRTGDALSERLADEPREKAEQVQTGLGC
jgi:hypothetical protein